MTMKTYHDIQDIPWSKDEWTYPIAGEEAVMLLRQCTDTTLLGEFPTQLGVEEVIEKSKAFPIPFPIESIRLEQLMKYTPSDKLRRNITSTYPLIHERVLMLMANFLINKRQFGTNIEKQFYKEMSICELIDRILKKRAASFVGPHDKYLLLSGKEGAGKWEEIGTSEEASPLVLENCLSYDEMKLSAMVYVSGYTECVNDGTRHNKGVVEREGAEDEAVIIGVIGPRFHRRDKMDCEDVLITKTQNTPQNGYAKVESSWWDIFKTKGMLDMLECKRERREMWADFYQTTNKTYDSVSWTVNRDAPKLYRERYFVLPKLKYLNPIFDNKTYSRRIGVIADCALLEADYRAKERSKSAFVNIIGCGLGVWLIAGPQPDVYVLTFLERIRALLETRSLDHVSDVNFAYIKTGPDVTEMFSNKDETEKQEGGKRWIFIENENHPKGGINVQMQDREPSSQLTGQHAGKLLVMTYPWDSNAHPGNEFWFGSLYTSGDPAAACSTQVSELHNAHINPAVSAYNTRVIGRHGIKTLSEYCLTLTT